MATLKSIRKRIHSVRNTQKITKAMKMVAAAKLRRAQSAVHGARPYVAKLREAVGLIAERLDEKDMPAVFKPKDAVRRVRLYVFSSNRGLCGGFNSNLMRATEGFRKDREHQGVACDIVAVGKKARDFLNARRVGILRSLLPWAETLPFDEALAETRELTKGFANGECDEAYVIYNRFVSTLSQKPTVERLLPVAVERGGTQGVDFLYEPGKKTILADILPRYFAGVFTVVHKESLASELGARMAAMESATKNASEMIGKLTLQYNRARQASITKELLDIVNGAEALKG